MTNTFTTNLALILQENGTNNNTWNDYLTDNFEEIDDKFGAITTVNTTGGNTSLTAAQERVAVIKVTGTLVLDASITFTGVGGIWIIQNDTAGDFILTCKASGQTGVDIVQGGRIAVYFNGTDIEAIGAGSGGDTGEVTITAFAESLLDDASASAMRATLGLVAGATGDIWVEKAGDTMTGKLFLARSDAGDMLHLRNTAAGNDLVMRVSTDSIAFWSEAGASGIQYFKFGTAQEFINSFCNNAASLGSISFSDEGGPPVGARLLAKAPAGNWGYYTVAVS